MAAGGEERGSSVPDDEWDRFLRESVNGTPDDAPKEPSARAREVTRRLRDEPAPPQPWRTYTPARPKRRTGWYVAGLLAALAVLVVALVPGLSSGWFGDEGTVQPLAVESERPNDPPPLEDAQRPTLDEPFKGSPAARWADGAAGVTVPAAKATGWMSKAEVARALDRSREFLNVSNLDAKVLRGEHPARATALINPDQKDVQDFLKTAFRAPSEEDDPLMLFSRFDPAHTRPVGDVVKTRGRMTYREGAKGALQVTADVTYVYPVAPAAGSDEVVRTIVRRELVLSWDDPAKVITEPGTFSLVSYKLDSTNGGCGDSTGYFTPEFGSARPTGRSGGPEVDPYDRSTPMDEHLRAAGDAECGTASRS
ncbi:hypothetical protein ACFV0R_02420 [Streptomyces sp. NPDC059578]|uniref:hypothetical protein n=1 Tax=Streptomyces sp. NPDC059578 TaxID=3346874 RepID=UPI003674CD43